MGVCSGMTVLLRVCTIAGYACKWKGKFNRNSPAAEKVRVQVALVSYARRSHNQFVNADAMYKLAADVGSALAAVNKTLVTAESCTGGWLAKAITDIAGSSGWFEQGFITYSNRAKNEQLGVGAALIAEYGAVSRQVVEAMATGALKYSPADIAVAVSGIAGPEGGSPEKPVGTVWFAWAARNRPQVYSECSLFSGNREQIRSAAVARGLAGILDMLQRI